MTQDASSSSTGSEDGHLRHVTRTREQVRGMGAELPRDCAVRGQEVPSCDTGPAGRLAFVVTEIRAAWRRRQQRKTASAAMGSD